MESAVVLDIPGPYKSLAEKFEAANPDIGVPVWSVTKTVPCTWVLDVGAKVPFALSSVIAVSGPLGELSLFLQLGISSERASAVRRKTVNGTLRMVPPS